MHTAIRIFLDARLDLFFVANDADLINQLIGQRAARLLSVFGCPALSNGVGCFLAWAGYADAAGTITEGWAAKDRAKTGGALTDEMIDEIAIIGTEEEIRERIQSDADGGVHTSIIAPLAATPEDLERTFEAFTADKFQLRQS